MIKQILIVYLLVSGGIFFITTSIAMLRFTDFYSRLHASSKCLTGGALSILLVYLIQSESHFMGLKILLLIAFILVTNPLASHTLARVAYQQRCHVEQLLHDEYKEDFEKIR